MERSVFFWWRSEREDRRLERIVVVLIADLVDGNKWLCTDLDLQLDCY